MASTARQWSTRVTHLHANLAFEGPVFLGPGFSMNIIERGTVRFGPGVDCRRNFVCEVAGNGVVTIGARSMFGGTTMLQCTTSVEIGEDTTFAHGVLIVDGNHRFRDHEVGIRDQGYEFRPIRIGPGALVHTNCTIINDVGEHAVIGANSVVSRPIPPYCLAVGAPARVVEYFGPPDREVEYLGTP